MIINILVIKRYENQKEKMLGKRNREFTSFTRIVRHCPKSACEIKKNMNKIKKSRLEDICISTNNCSTVIIQAKNKMCSVPEHNILHMSDLELSLNNVMKQEKLEEEAEIRQMNEQYYDDLEDFYGKIY